MKKSLLVIALVTCIACNREIRTTEESDAVVERISFGHKITQADALQIAEKAPSLFSNDVLTKATKRQVLEGIPVTTGSHATTKGGYQQIDTLMYLFNYADSMGYVFVSTDERTGDVIAFIEKGNFNIQDTAKNKLSNFLVSLMLNYQQTMFEELREIESSNTTKGSVGPSGPSDKTYGAYLRNGQGPMCNKVLKSDCNYGAPVTAPYEAQVQGDYYYKNKGCMATREFREPDINIGPLLTTQWNQDKPFNNNAPMIGSNSAATGCTAIATAQVMVYHSFPTNYPSNIHNGTPTSIASLRKIKQAADFTSSANKDCVARFVRTVGDLIGNSWGFPETGGSQYNVPGCFAKMGYSNPSSVVAYNNTKIVNSLNVGRPVIAIGWRQVNPKKGGHVWVIDGYKAFRSGYDNYYFDEYGRFNGSKFGAYRDIEEVHLHCNFGWGVGDDGYYFNKIFKSYIYDLEIIPNIHK